MYNVALQTYVSARGILTSRSANFDVNDWFNSYDWHVLTRAVKTTSLLINIYGKTYRIYA